MVLIVRHCWGVFSIVFGWEHFYIYDTSFERSPLTEYYCKKGGIYVLSSLFIKGELDHPCAIYTEFFNRCTKRPEMALLRRWGRFGKFSHVKLGRAILYSKGLLYPRHFVKVFSIIAIYTSKVPQSVEMLGIKRLLYCIHIHATSEGYEIVIPKVLTT